MKHMSSPYLLALGLTLGLTSGGIFASDENEATSSFRIRQPLPAEVMRAQFVPAPTVPLGQTSAEAAADYNAHVMNQQTEQEANIRDVLKKIEDLHPTPDTALCPTPTGTPPKNTLDPLRPAPTTAVMGDSDEVDEEGTGEFITLEVATEEIEKQNHLGGSYQLTSKANHRGHTQIIGKNGQIGYIDPQPLSNGQIRGVYILIENENGSIRFYLKGDCYFFPKEDEGILDQKWLGGPMHGHKYLDLTPATR